MAAQMERRERNQPHITVIRYNQTEVQEYDLVQLQGHSFGQDGRSIIWVDIDGTEDAEVARSICDSFHLNHNVLLDVGTGLRPKVEECDSFIHIVLRMMRYRTNGSRDIVTEQVHLLLGHDFVISIQEGEEGDVFNSVRDRIRLNRGSIRKSGPDYLIYALLEAVIDNYFVILEEIGEEIEDIQDEMLNNPTAHLLRRVRDLKTSVRFVRKAVWPLREVIGELEREDSPLINDEINAHFRRAYEHTIQAMDVAEAARDVLSDMLDIYLSSISNRLNQVMKTLTIITTIFMPLSFIAGVYGMNFHFMPELTWRFGYPLVLGAMALIVALMLIYFRRKDWL